MGAKVTIVDRSMTALRRAANHFGAAAGTVFSTRNALERLAEKADLMIGGVLVAGGTAPKLVTAEMIKKMKTGAVFVDVSIDQGGCSETSRPTTHADPTYVVDDVVHYCVTNMPGAVARTSTFALNNATLPFVLALADDGWKKAMANDPHLRKGLNIHAGQVTHPAVAEALGLPLSPADAIVGAMPMRRQSDVRA
jgi:alanine dehydrogenase